MELKYTFEILTKDIQDIEKLLENLQNSPDGSAIELDLAMSKLRNVYEILTMIKADRLHTLISPDKITESKPAPHPEPVAAPEPVVTQEPETNPNKEAEILAEKFSAESSINENLAEQRGKDVDTKLHGQPIENISRNIGINDRFLIIRELFNGDADKFSTMVKNLEGAGSYQNAANLLDAQFPDLN
ncbi:MAG: hypothetical protein DRI70_05550, partial [Bacteroidetes bacterium]